MLKDSVKTVAPAFSADMAASAAEDDESVDSALLEDSESLSSRSDSSLNGSSEQADNERNEKNANAKCIFFTKKLQLQL